MYGENGVAALCLSADGLKNCAYSSTPGSLGGARFKPVVGLVQSVQGEEAAYMPVSSGPVELLLTAVLRSKLSHAQNWASPVYKTTN